MNTKSKLIEELNDRFNDFDFEHERVMIQMRIISEVERAMDEKDMTYKQLAELTGFSTSFISQLFKGHKKLNLDTIAKFQIVLDRKFKVELLADEDFYKEKTPPRFVKMQIVKNNITEQEQIAV